MNKDIYIERCIQEAFNVFEEDIKQNADRESYKCMDIDIKTKIFIEVVEQTINKWR